MPNYIYFFIILTICNLINTQENLDNISSIIKRFGNQHHCPNGWRKLGGSCYYFPHIISTFNAANDTCHSFHSNLIEIRTPLDFLAAAYLSRKYNLSSLMISLNRENSIIKEISTIDQNRWQSIKDKYRQNRIESNQVKQEIINALNSTNIRILKFLKKFKKRKFLNDSYEYTDLYSLDDIDEIENICSQIHWNIRDNPTNIYVLKIYQSLDKIICSINNLQSKLKYNYICHYVFDPCFANDICGKHGNCVNILSNFKCSCSFLYDGDYCEKISSRSLQIIFGIILYVLLVVLSLSKKFRTKKKISSNELINNRSIKPINLSYEYDLTRLVLISILAVIFLSFLLIITTIQHFLSLQYDLPKNITLTQCKYISDYRVENLIFFPVGICLVLIFSLYLPDKKLCLISPIKPFSTTNRFLTAAIFGMLALEILNIFEELIFNLENSSNSGIFFELLQRIGLIVLIGFRYYPVLASLQLQYISTRLSICLYMMADMIFTIIREGLCTDFSDEVELDTWLIIYSIIKNTPHFIFLSYINAELWVRFFYDSNGKIENDESKFAKYYLTKLFQQNHLKKNVKTYFDYIYQWDDHFRYTTLITCTYTVACVILYYISCTFGFLYIFSSTNYIKNFKLYIGLDSINLIIISIIITFIFFSFQLFVEMKNYKKHKLQLYQGVYYEIPLGINIIHINSIHYPGFLIGYLILSFIVIFHLILMIQIITWIYFIKIFLDFILPIFIIYLLSITGMSLIGQFIIPDTVSVILLYFSFFADCFLGIISCIIRFLKATFFNIINMSRLDYNIFGRSIEKLDFGFETYITYLHIEKIHTHPVMIAFCYLIYDEILQRRSKPYLDKETDEHHYDNIQTREIHLLRTISYRQAQKCEITIEEEHETQCVENQPITFFEIERTKRQKQVRFRWFLAYTLLNNSYLRHQRKHIL